MQWWAIFSGQQSNLVSCASLLSAKKYVVEALCSCAIVLYYGLLRQPFFVVSCDLTCAYCYLLPVIHVRCFFFLCSVSICVCVVCLIELVAYALSLLRSTLTPLFVIFVSPMLTPDAYRCIRYMIVGYCLYSLCTLFSLSQVVPALLIRSPLVVLTWSFYPLNNAMWE